VFTQIFSCKSGRQKPGPNAAYANLSLNKIRIFEAYLKRLIGCVILRNLVLNSLCAKRECLGKYC
jgi:hypothetical protein